MRNIANTACTWLVNRNANDSARSARPPDSETRKGHVLSQRTLASSKHFWQDHAIGAADVHQHMQQASKPDDMSWAHEPVLADQIRLQIICALQADASLKISQCLEIIPNANCRVRAAARLPTLHARRRHDGNTVGLKMAVEI